MLENAHLPKAFPWKNAWKNDWENDHLPKAFFRARKNAFRARQMPGKWSFNSGKNAHLPKAFSGKMTGKCSFTLEK